jgi:hypothetical protein
MPSRMRKRSESRAANCNPVKATQLISPHSMFSCMGLRPTESDYLLKLKTAIKHQEKNDQLPKFCPFQAQDSNVSVQIGKVGL